PQHDDLPALSRGLGPLRVDSVVWSDRARGRELRSPPRLGPARQDRAVRGVGERWLSPALAPVANRGPVAAVSRGGVGRDGAEGLRTARARRHPRRGGGSSVRRHAAPEGGAMTPEGVRAPGYRGAVPSRRFRLEGPARRIAAAVALVVVLVAAAVGV